MRGVRRADSRQDERVDDAPDELRVDALTVDGPHQAHSRQGVGDQRPVPIGCELAARHRLVQDGRHRAPALEDHQVVEGCGEMLIVHRLHRHPQYQIVGDPLTVVARHTLHQRVEITDKAAGVRGIIVDQVGPPVHQCVGDQRGFR
jgi:hypothetical protein